jgi:hypothetical protein
MAPGTTYRATNWVNAFLYAAARGDSNPLATGRLGNYLGAEFIVTSQARIFASLGFSAADVYASLLIGDGAYGVVELSSQTARTFFKPVGSGGSTGDPIDQVWFRKRPRNPAVSVNSQNGRRRGNLRKQRVRRDCTRDFATAKKTQSELHRNVQSTTEMLVPHLVVSNNCSRMESKPRCRNFEPKLYGSNRVFGSTRSHGLMLAA